MGAQNNNVSYFVAFCIEQYKHAHNISGRDAMRTLNSYGVLDYLVEHFEILHTQSKQWILEDIEEFIRIRKEKGCYDKGIMLWIWQLHKTICIFSCRQRRAVADFLSDEKNISIVDAFEAIYNSDTYSRLENEVTKLWHLGPVALYESMM